MRAAAADGAEIVQSNVGEYVWLTWLPDAFQENFKIAEVDRCIAGSREAQENDKPPVGMSLAIVIAQTFVRFIIRCRLYPCSATEYCSACNLMRVK